MSDNTPYLDMNAASAQYQRVNKWQEDWETQSSLVANLAAERNGIEMAQEETAGGSQHCTSADFAEILATDGSTCRVVSE